MLILPNIPWPISDDFADKHHNFEKEEALGLFKYFVQRNFVDTVTVM